jgi:hypothetical protein
MDKHGSELTLDKALSAHAEWKARLRAAAQAKETLDLDTIRRDDCCDLGRWLYADGQRLYGTKPEFVHLVDKHKEFHLVTGMVAGIINGKDFETSKSMIEGSSQFASASMDVGMAILKLKKAVKA